jgi:hypothetical protein
MRCGQLAINAIWQTLGITNVLFAHKLNYLLTELSPSSGAVNCAAPQEPPSILWNPKVQYRVHKSPPLVPIPSHISPIHSIPSYLSKIRFHIVNPPMSWVFLVVSFLLACPPISYMHSFQVMWNLSWAKWRWGKFSPSASLSAVNSHSTDCSTLIIYYPGLV